MCKAWYQIAIDGEKSYSNLTPEQAARWPGAVPVEGWDEEAQRRLADLLASFPPEGELERLESITAEIRRGRV